MAPHKSDIHMSALFPIYIIVVAAGSGSRFGGDIPKQFRNLKGRPVLMHTIDRLRTASPEATLILVLSEAEVQRWRDLCAEFNFDSPEVTTGGSSRWESVKNGLAVIPSNANPNSIVLIHDGARPLVDQPTVKRVCAAAVNTDGAIPAIPVTDSLRQLDENEVASTPVDRSLFRAVQTPQGFSLWRLRQAYSLPWQPEFTDDASVLAAAGFANIFLVEGNPDNIKITNPRDIAIAEAIISFGQK